MIPMYRLSLIGLYGLYGPRSAVPRKAAKFNHSLTPPMMTFTYDPTHDLGLGLCISFSKRGVSSTTL